MIPTDKKQLAAVIPAAGESSRTGTPKMLLRFGEKTMIEQVVLNFTESQVSEIVVVLGAWKDEILKVISEYDIKYRINEEYNRGMLSSVICGIRSLSSGIRAAVILPGDYPFIRGSFIDEFADAFLGSGKGIGIPVSGGRKGHPIILDKKYFGMVETLNPSGGLREIIGLHEEDVFKYYTDNDYIHTDIDTMEDYFASTGKI
ncbi:MAG TPA: nucleotidyltransferase family protein [Bacteroidales bacterium]|nr:nucleotidyltransferase family protein [Bacteroidales bacterium]HRR93408.1 nucleotidyltransferase family protein [Bacteroidales bacterium]